MFFNLVLKFGSVNEFFWTPKRHGAVLHYIFFPSIHLLIVVMQTAGKKVHGVVLVYRLISRQPPLCVFDDAFNLSVYHSNTVV